MMAARSVGGDFFDFFLIDEERLGLVIGDVSGKGVPAALYMAVTLTHLRSTAQQGMAPEDCLLEVNLSEFTVGAPQFDDITTFAVRRA